MTEIKPHPVKTRSAGSHGSGHKSAACSAGSHGSGHNTATSRSTASEPINLQNNTKDYGHGTTYVHVYTKDPQDCIEIFLSLKQD